MALSLSNVNECLDEICRVYARVLGVEGASSYGMGETGDADRGAGAADDLTATVLAIADANVVSLLLPRATSFANSLSSRKLSCPKGFLTRLESLIRDLGLTGVTSLESYLAYYNYGAGGENTALQSAYWRLLYYTWKGVYPSARNLYFQVLEGGHFMGDDFTDGLRSKVVGGAETAGFTIPTDYAGGVPYVYVTGFAGASDTVTVTGTQFDPDTGNRTASKTWTATVNNNGAFALASGGGTPADADALICAASGITIGASITASTRVVVEARRPSGRLAIPF